MIFLNGNLDISPDSLKDYHIERLIRSDLVIASNRQPKSSLTIPNRVQVLTQSINLLIRIATGMPKRINEHGSNLEIEI